MRWGCASAVLWLGLQLFGAEPLVHLHFSRTSQSLNISWDGSPEGLAAPAELRLERSDDLVHWKEAGQRMILPAGSRDRWQQQLVIEGNKSFFRLRSNFSVQIVGETSEEVLGYAGAFAEALGAIGPISVDHFQDQFAPKFSYVDQISWDPTSAQYFPEFNSPPRVIRDLYGYVIPLPDLTLNAAELEVFKKIGFVVSERLGTTNFADGFYNIFVRDLPVFISSDSVLHAWHRSFEAMLEQTEELWLAPALSNMVFQMSAQLPALENEKWGGATFGQSLVHADYYLTVARSLIQGTPAPALFGQDLFVCQTLDLIAQGGIAPFNLFGRLDSDPLFLFDFSQFRVRSHYVNSTILHRYFQVMMWVSRVDFRVAGKLSSPRELATAIVITELLKRSGQFDLWRQIDQFEQEFIGPRDSMCATEMAALLQAVQFKPEGITALDDLRQIQTALFNGQYGVQQIMADLFYSPLSPEQIKLPRSFTFLGQRFTPDSWALGQVVFDRVLWPGRPGNGTRRSYYKVLRRMASGLDAAFAALGNDETVPIIADRIRNAQGVPFRDGLPYQHNLAAVRRVLDTQEGASENVYTDWLNTLAMLSRSSLDVNLPESMRTREYGMKLLNTQLASWAELHHDTVLYVKPPSVGGILCFYPRAFVEPIPAFWNALGEQAKRTSDHLMRLTLAGSAPWEDRAGEHTFGDVDLGVTKSYQFQFLERFSTNCFTLRNIAEKELRQEAPNTNEDLFLGDWIEKIRTYTGEKDFTGWYPRLFYRSNEGLDYVTLAIERMKYRPDDHDSAKNVGLITDVLTDPPAPLVGDPGGILNEAVGNADFMLIAIENGPDRCVYGGPVFSYYEMIDHTMVRKTDAEWQQTLISGQVPSRPEWTKGWVVQRQ
jgi:hypothetical protein